MWQDLRSNRMHLRALDRADEGPITLYAGDRRVAWMTGPIPHPYPPGAAAAYIDAALSGRGQTVWALDATPSGGASFLGVIAFTPQTATIGYWIGPPFWRQGYATEAAQTVSDHLLGHLPELHASAMVENTASQKVLQRAGFVRSGTRQSHSIARGHNVDIYTYRRAA